MEIFNTVDMKSYYRNYIGNFYVTSIREVKLEIFWRVTLCCFSTVSLASSGKGIYREALKAKYRWDPNVPFCSLNNGANNKKQDKGGKLTLAGKRLDFFVLVMRSLMTSKMVLHRNRIVHISHPNTIPYCVMKVKHNLNTFSDARRAKKEDLVQIAPYLMRRYEVEVRPEIQFKENGHLVRIPK